jgi:hypothetical protein
MNLTPADDDEWEAAGLNLDSLKLVFFETAFQIDVLNYYNYDLLCMLS